MNRLSSGKGIRNAYGYYMAVAGLLEFIKERNLVLNDEFESSLIQWNEFYLSTAATWFGESSEEDGKQFLSTLPQAMRIGFVAEIGALHKELGNATEIRRELIELKSRTKGKSSKKTFKRRVKKLLRKPYRALKSSLRT